MKDLSDITLEYRQSNPEDRNKELDGYFRELKFHVTEWEGKEYRASNDRLYSILQKCYATAKEMSGTNPSHEKMKTSFSDYCESHGYKFQDSTPLVKRIVRVVFAEPAEKSWKRSRISAYGKALVILDKNHVAPENVIEVLKNYGGIEEVRQVDGDLGEQVDQAKRGKKIVEQKAVIASLASRELVYSLDQEKMSDVVLLVATRVGNTFEIRETVQKPTLLNSVLKDIGKRYKNMEIDLDELEQDGDESHTTRISLNEALTMNKSVNSSPMAQGLSAATKKEPELA